MVSVADEEGLAPVSVCTGGSVSAAALSSLSVSGLVSSCAAASRAGSCSTPMSKDHPTRTVEPVTVPPAALRALTLSKT